MTSPRRGSTHYIHRISYSTQEKLVGLFVLTALVVFLTLFIVNSRQLHLFDNPLRFQLQVKTAEGISRDTPVRISGIQVGRVDRIEITEEHNIILYARVHEAYKNLVRADSVASIGKLSLLGRSSIEITPGSPHQPLLAEGSFLPVEEPLSIDDLLAQVEPVLLAAEETVQNIALISGAINPDVIERLLANAYLVSEDVQNMTGQVAAGEGPVGSLLFDAAMQQQITNSLAQLETLLQGLEARVDQLEPTLQQVEGISRETHQQLPGILAESSQLLRQVNTTLSGVNQEMTHLPDLLERVDLLMDQTDLLLDRIANTWPLSRGDSAVSPRLIEVAPHD